MWTKGIGFTLVALQRFDLWKDATIEVYGEELWGQCFSPSDEGQRRFLAALVARLERERAR